MRIGIQSIVTGHWATIRQYTNLLRVLQTKMNRSRNCKLDPGEMRRDIKNYFTVVKTIENR